MDRAWPKERAEAFARGMEEERRRSVPDPAGELEKQRGFLASARGVVREMVAGRVEDGLLPRYALKDYDECEIPFFEAKVREWERIAADPEAFYRGEIPTAEEKAEMDRLRRDWLGSKGCREEDLERGRQA